MYVWVEWVRESNMAKLPYIQKRDMNLQWNLFSSFSTFMYRAISRHQITLIFPHYSTFASIVQSYLKASNHLKFFLLLYLYDSGINSGSSQPPNPGQSGTRPVPKAKWPQVAVFSVVCETSLPFCFVLYFHES